MRRLTRRQFLQRAAELGAAAQGAMLVACGDSSELRGALAAAQPLDLGQFQFADAQRRTLSAAVARLIPAQGAGDWSAVDAGAVEYIEQLLNAFSPAAANPKLYGGGPTRPHFGEFHPVSRAKAIGWQHEIARLRDLYVAGLDNLDVQALGDFAAAPAAQQDLILEMLDYQTAPFFATLFNHTMEGCYAHPVYGGNKDYVGWDSVCYEGDVHGVRFPGGEDANADAEPWRKFGGYSPDEIVAPGACAGSKRSRT